MEMTDRSNGQSQSGAPPPVPNRDGKDNSYQVKGLTFHGQSSPETGQSGWRIVLDNKRTSLSPESFSNKLNITAFRRGVMLPSDDNDLHETAPNRDTAPSLQTNSAPSSPVRPNGVASPLTRSHPPSPSRAPSKTLPSSAKSNIESEYLEQLYQSRMEDYTKERSYGFLYPAGRDTAGRPIVVVVADRFPNAKNLDMDRLLRFVICTLDGIVDNEYSAVFAVTSSPNGNGGRPSFSWLRKAYRILSRKYKKNLKSLYIIHAPMWIKGIMRMFKPFISAKFWQKLVYVEDVNTIYKYIHKDQLMLPDFVIHHQTGGKKVSKVFGVTLGEVMGRPDHDSHKIPIVVERSVQYLYRCHANTIQGIFRLSGSSQQIQALRKKFDLGEASFDTVDDPHVVAGLLKLFLREMAEPLFPFDSYPRLIEAYKTSGPDSLNAITNIVDDLPLINRALLETLLDVTSYVERNSAVNQMTSSNLSIVFAPNIIRQTSETMQQAIMDSPIINSIVRMLIENPDKVLRRGGKGEEGKKEATRSHVPPINLMD
ncbi:RhoGAP domain-containing protein [Planoprotostelium fungivorum]|uniref:RhoGAP domain-containing protein n=1 Tax=Planoprotostelium fungivorum TaxID=1890364 RepID=A0A2P6NN02_9EUKA|nr:RhoGAP domain-containing protein [Planoprotostelium fungivorum]